MVASDSVETRSVCYWQLFSTYYAETYVKGLNDSLLFENSPAYWVSV